MKNYAYVSSGGMYKDSDEVCFVQLALIYDLGCSPVFMLKKTFLLQGRFERLQHATVGNILAKLGWCYISRGMCGKLYAHDIFLQVPFTESSDVKESGQRQVEKHIADMGLPWTSFRRVALGRSMLALEGLFGL